MEIMCNGLFKVNVTNINDADIPAYISQIQNKLKKDVDYKKEISKLRVKNRNLKKTGGLCKYVTINGYIKPKTLKESKNYEEEISDLRIETKACIREKINQKNSIFRNDKLIVDVSIKNSGLLNECRVDKGTFFYVEYYLTLKDEGILTKRSLINKELNKITNLIITEVIDKNEDFLFV